MSPTLIEFDGGFSCYALSEIEARFIHQEVFVDHAYGDEDLGEAPFIVDVGANIGLFSLNMRRRYPGARIVAYEPAPETACVLRRNLELHGITDITVHTHALGAEAGTAAFTYYPAMPGNSTFYPEGKARQKQVTAELLGAEQAEASFASNPLTVGVERLSRSLAEHHPDRAVIDLLKIDVEGAELDVLAGIDETDWARIRNVALEVHNTAVSQVDDVEELLRDKGMTVTSELHPLLGQVLGVCNVRACR
ncbi:FkbM family methyltransferase [Streptomyces sp. NPDC039016]|uniref:FkbM family methyltransferase n=1 Tax=Streptomyces sp. NPDC039016 TaxID=3154330 RepID=UPI0033C7E82B